MIWYSLTEDQRITKTKILRKNRWSPPGKCFPQNIAFPPSESKNRDDVTRLLQNYIQLLCIISTDFLRTLIDLQFNSI